MKQANHSTTKGSLASSQFWRAPKSAQQTDDCADDINDKWPQRSNDSQHGYGASRDALPSRVVSFETVELAEAVLFGWTRAAFATGAKIQARSRRRAAGIGGVNGLDSVHCASNSNFATVERALPQRPDG
jgi:hypothetical protein